MAVPLLSVAQFRIRTVMPGEDVDALEAAYPGFLEARIAQTQSWIEGRLRKRYALPFADGKAPEVVLGWLTAIVTLAAYIRRGFNPSSAQDQEIVKGAEAAQAEVREAADAKDGLFDLPLRQDLPGSSGISGAPLGYAEASPYTWIDRQVGGGRE